MRNDKAISDYAAKRLSNVRDDREESHVFGPKHKMDAELRGKVGRQEADRIIDAIDKIKQVR